jgi:hypothetical protein
LPYLDDIGILENVLVRLKDIIILTAVSVILFCYFPESVSLYDFMILLSRPFACSARLLDLFLLSHVFHLLLYKELNIQDYLLTGQSRE